MPHHFSPLIFKGIVFRRSLRRPFSLITCLGELMNLLSRLVAKSATTVFCLLSVFALGSGHARGDESWATFRLPADVSFSVSAPVTLQKLEGRDEWRATDADGRLYGVGMGYYTEPQKITNPIPFMRMMIDRLATNLKARVAYSYFFKYQFAPACEFKLVDVENHQIAAGRYFLVHQWFYFLNYTTSDKTFDVNGMKKFFESFQMFNPGLKSFQPISE